MQDHRLSSSQPPQQINHTSLFLHVIDNAASARRLATSLLPHPSPISTAGVDRGWGPGTGACCAATRATKEMPHALPLPGWNRSRIATDVVGVIDLSMPRRLYLGYSQHKRRPIVTIGRSGYHNRPGGLTVTVTSPSLMDEAQQGFLQCHEPGARGVSKRASAAARCSARTRGCY
jgi:hypothetical protein